MKSKWEVYDPYAKTDVEVFFNYCITALFTTVMISFFLYWVQGFTFHPIITYLFLYVAVTIFIILYEHYFKWHMADWKKDKYEVVHLNEETIKQRDATDAEAKARQAELDAMKKEDEFYNSGN